ncbi:MAG TPA: metalloregulator ArsR/SmtB family transcription factor [Acidimicrobiales bacterium]
MLDQADPLDRVFQALADPSRRLMVERLSRGPASVSELARPFSMSLAAVVQHVQVLEACGLVRSEKVGRVRTCQIAPATLHSAERWIAERRSTWERRLDALGEYLAEHPDPAEPAGPVAPSTVGPAQPGPTHPDPTHPDQAHPDQGSIR